MKTWLTADWHLGENRFAQMNRPGFASPQEMVDTFVELHNEVVAPEDLVIVVGDVCYSKAPEYLPQVGRFNGRKTLVRGNHDRDIPDDLFGQYFESVVPEGDGIEIDADGLACYVTHYPTRGRADLFNLVGHIHSAWKFQLNMLNVGVDVNHFRPVDLAAMPGHFKAINEFYDRDVWIAYAPVNALFAEKRGLDNSRFPAPLQEKKNDQ